MVLAIKSLFLQFAGKKKLNFLWEQAVPRKLTNLIPEIREIKPVSGGLIDVLTLSLSLMTCCLIEQRSHRKIGFAVEAYRRLNIDQTTLPDVTQPYVTV